MKLHNYPLQKLEKNLAMDYKIPILKTITYRILGSLTSMTIAYATTNDYMVGVAVGSADLIIKPIIYYIHELLWQKKNP